MRIVVLFSIAMLIADVSRALERLPGEGANASQYIPEACSPEFWRHAVTVATGHGTNIEMEARQIGRIRCDCTFVKGQSRSCQASIVSEDEAVSPETEE